MTARSRVAPPRRWTLGAITAVVIAFAPASCGKDATGPAAFRIRFVTQPAGAVAGIAQTVEVELLDDDGTRMTSARDRITLTLTGDPAVRWFANAVAGVATFDDVIIEATSLSHTLRATLAQLTAVSLPFVVAPAGPSEEHTTIDAGGTEFESNTPFDLTLTVRDAFANGVANSSVSLSAPGATFTPASGSTGPDGTFTTSVRAPPGDLTVTVNVDGANYQLASGLTITDACTPQPMTVPGSVNGMLAAGQGCIADGRATRIYQFSVAAEGGVTFQVSPTFDATYEVRFEPAHPQLAFVTDDPQSTEWLLLPGTYQFRVGASSGSGTYSVTTTTGPGNTGQIARVLARAGTYTGQSLATDDLYDGTWYSDVFLIGDIRPCTITVRSTAFDAYLQLFDVFTGSLIWSTDDGGGGTDAGVVRNSCLTIPSQIPIVISPSSAFADEVGPYTLTVTFQTPAPGSPAAVSAPIRAGSAKIRGSQ